MYGHPNCNRMPGPGDEETWPSCSGHPNDPRTPEPTAEKEERQGIQREEYLSRVNDLGGSLIESFTEAPEEALKELAQAIADEDEAQIGHTVIRMVKSYCYPVGEIW